MNLGFDFANFRWKLVSMTTIWFCVLPLLAAGSIHSYVDESGARVFTNLGTNRAGEILSKIGAEASAEGNYIPLIQDFAAEYEVDEDLIESIVKVESNFDPYAVSEKDCKGLMQLHPDTAKRFGVSEIFDPAENLRGGIEYLRYLMGLFDENLDLVLAGYNAGENAVKRHGGIPPYAETIAYVDKVKKLYRDKSASKGGRRPAPIVRTVDANGRILLTNTPSLQVR